ncbi:MAG: autotransporter outer membrane beta-barrel domain-containing protein, partial [Planctomycetaceae bacterium]|nr:autotransporter outer membrane beta-barrel domain-containing protein [Planctomycetaceae bacterium]
MRRTIKTTAKSAESVISAVSLQKKEGETKIRFYLKTVWFCFVLFLFLFLFLFCPTAHAQPAQVVNVLNKDKETIFQLDFYEGFSPEQVGAITEAAQYWVNILKAHGTMPFMLDGAGNKITALDDNDNPILDAVGNPTYQRQPVVFSIFYDDTLAGNANAITNGYVQSNIDQYNLDLPLALLTDGVYVPLVDGGHATINVGSGWNAVVGNQSQSGRVLNDLTPVLIHEMGHALGIASSVTYDIDPITEEIKWKFPDTLSRYDSRLRDNNGNSASVRPGASGKEVGYDNTANHSQATTIFDMGDPLAPYIQGNPSHPTFVGKNVLELWYGKSVNKLTKFEQNSGVPVTGYTYDIGWNYPYFPLQWQYNPSGTLSHIDTANSLMSWQEYRNYPGFIEIELAVMQDVGYTVERRDFFGKSFYVNGDGTPFYNSATFGYWNAALQSYDMSRPNISSYAIGAHLFAKDLNVIQTGSIWANGPGSAGIRIDGSNNKLTIARGTSVYADGVNGIGILAAYGKDHSIILQEGSYVHATGRNGIGVSFNFGKDLFGSNRGSYYYTLVPVANDQTSGIVYVDYKILDELNGALVKNFDISGSITGSRSYETVTLEPQWSVSKSLAETDRRFAFGAAVYIDGTAQVDQINIMNGAKINGDILSFHRNVLAQDLSTDSLTDQQSTPPEVRDALLGRYSLLQTLPHRTASELGEALSGQYAALNLHTNITFGYKADANGAATTQIDDNFNFTFKDNINYFRYEIIPNILYLDPARVIISPNTANSDPKLKEALEQMGATINARGNMIDLPVGHDQGTGFYPGNEVDDNGDIAETEVEIETGEEEEDANIPLREDRGYWISPSYEDDDALWAAVVKADGLNIAVTEGEEGGTGGEENVVTFNGDAVTIVKPGDGKVYADIVTPGAETTLLHFVGGTTEFQGNTVYAKNLTIDRGATLMLTPAIPKDVSSTINVKVVDTNGNPFLDANSNPLVDENGQPFEIECLLSPLTNTTLKIPEINISANFDFEVLAEVQTNETSNAYRMIPHPNPPTMDNFGRIAGEGVFRFGQRRYAWDINMYEQYGALRESCYWEGTLNNEGVISPGAKNGDEIGIINVVGDLTFGKNSVYEVTVGGSTLMERYTSAITQDGQYIDEKGNIYDPTIGQVRAWNVDPNTEIGETPNSNPNISPEELPIRHETIYGTENDLLVVLNNTKMDGTVKVTFLPDKVFGNETTTHTIIQSGTFTQGSNFKKVDYETGFLYVSDVFINPYNSHEAQFLVVRDLNYFQDRAKTFNEKSAAAAIDNSLFERPDIAFSLGDASNSVADLRDIYRQIGASVRANSALINLWNPSELLFNRIGYGNGSMPTGNRGRVNWNRMLGQTPALRRTGGLWGDFTQTYFNAESDGNSDSYNISRSGFMVGGEWNLTPYSAIGAIAAYANSNLKQVGDKMESDDYVLGTYFVCAPFNEFEFKTYIGLGFQEYDMDRYVRNTNIVYDSVTGAKGIFERYLSNTKGNTFNLSLELSRPLMLHPTFILRPTLGFD